MGYSMQPRAVCMVSYVRPPSNPPCALIVPCGELSLTKHKNIMRKELDLLIEQLRNSMAYAQSNAEHNAYKTRYEALCKHRMEMYGY